VLSKAPAVLGMVGAVNKDPNPTDVSDGSQVVMTLRLPMLAAVAVALLGIPASAAAVDAECGLEGMKPCAGVFLL
jgi:hypothetical protein